MLDRPLTNIDADGLGETEARMQVLAQQTMIDLTEPSDEVLAQRLLSKDLNAFSQLYDRHVDVVYGLALYMVGRDEAEEAVQEVFLRLWQKRDKYEPSRGAFRPWFLAVARNHFLDLLRRRRLHRHLQVASEIEELLAAVEGDSPDATDAAWQRQRALAVRTALSSIPQEQQQVIVLAFFGGLSQSAIARQLHTPLGTVKKRTRLGMQKLRANLGQMGLFEDESNHVKGIET